MTEDGWSWLTRKFSVLLELATLEFFSAYFPKVSEFFSSYNQHKSAFARRIIFFLSNLRYLGEKISKKGGKFFEIRANRYGFRGCKME